MDKQEILDNTKYPVSRDNHVGIEIEFVSPMENYDLEDILMKLNLQNNCHIGGDGSIDEFLPSKRKEKPSFDHACEKPGYQPYIKHPNNPLAMIKNYCEGCSKEDDWEDENDLNDYATGHELRILCTERDLQYTLNLVNLFLKSAKAEVNDSCGLHVHLDMRNRDFGTTIDRLMSKQKEMHKLVDKKRLTSTYCKPLTAAQAKKKSSDKYRDINLSAYKDLGTIEIRIHEGCVNTSEIYNWSRYLIAVADNKKVSKLYVKKRIAICA